MGSLVQGIYQLVTSSTCFCLKVFSYYLPHSCNARRYALPHAAAAQLSVVISFYNEARSMLLRTILTLISRTPEAYLHELIIIDDCSGDGEPLEMLII